MGGGGYIISNGSDDITGLTHGVASASIAIGAIVSIISFLGCFGAANEKGLLLKTYFALLVVLIILEVSVGAAAYAKRNEIPAQLDDAWIYLAQDPVHNSTLLGIEKQFNCCGFSSTVNYAIPTNCEDVYGFHISCQAKLEQSIEGSLNTIGGGGLAIGLIELVGLVFSVIMFRKISRKENAQSSLLNEAWRVNRQKVQYG
ncbi:hypothetical protein HDV03_004326 [Kappamyces sp. JEL0829]|nr:hypothetical protein HDV03_004326 [Kappamyces sp. JEL0829]